MHLKIEKIWPRFPAFSLRSFLPRRLLDYRDCAPFSGDEVSHEVKWEHRSIESLANQIVRLEFLLTRADLYTFRAGGGPTGGRPASSQD